MPLRMLIGGARCGKSALAVRRAQAHGGPVVFVATAEAGDAEMADRITRHRADRPSTWTTVEAPLDLAAAVAALPAGASAIVDCLALWTANLLVRGDDETRIVGQAREAADTAARRPELTIVVGNEVGLGVVPANELGRRYRDALGRVNAAWAERAGDVALVVAGRLLPLEPPDA